MHRCDLRRFFWDKLFNNLFWSLFFAHNFFPFKCDSFIVCNSDAWPFIHFNLLIPFLHRFTQLCGRFFEKRIFSFMKMPSMVKMEIIRISLTLFTGFKVPFSIKHRHLLPTQYRFLFRSMQPVYSMWYENKTPTTLSILSWFLHFLYIQ